MPTDTSLKALTLGDVEHELALTRRVLERVPDEHLDWRPHPKSWPLAALATHVANLLTWQRGTLLTDGFDLATLPPPLAALPSRAALLETFDRNAAALREALGQTDEAALRATWTLRRGEQVLAAQPKANMLRTWGISHLIHHRGQLSLYLRLLDVPVPGIYGPSADEPAPA